MLVQRIIIMIALLQLSACAPADHQVAQNAYDGFLLGNIYMGEGRI